MYQNKYLSDGFVSGGTSADVALRMGYYSDARRVRCLQKNLRLR